MLKQNIRVLGIDDGPFLRERDSMTCLTAVLMRMDWTIENVMIRYITVDGEDSGSAIAGFVRAVGRQNLSAIVAEGITFAGFNFIDPDEISRETGIPFISVTRSDGDVEAMASALTRHGNAEAARRIEALKPLKETIGETEFTINISGMERKDAILLLRRLMRVGNVPEPVRVAHMISKAFMDAHEIGR